MVVGLDALVRGVLQQPWVGVFRITVVASLLVPMLLVPTRHTMNDNTSGVDALLRLARALGGERRLKAKVKFVFTDNEEKSLLGTLLLRLLWRKQNVPLSRMRIVSVDSIGVGDTAVVSYNCVRRVAAEVARVFAQKGQRVRRLNKWLMPFSGAYFFGDVGAVNVDMMRRALLPGSYYIENIHSARDTALSQENVDTVVEALCDYAREVCREPPPTSERP